ncbi:MAG TPA: transcriptional regulator [Porphyromonadaceae bacterium]|nr:helix-turn-helix domain-containing protein [Paramuribaculum sp.]HAB41426.1 transcriptional regulator [Porphyromonadaceae bacterium]
MDKKQIGIQIKTRRRELNIDQSTLAALAGVGINTLVAIERGNGNPRLDTIISVADTLGLQIKLTLKG